jgi:hypothetical protein
VCEVEGRPGGRNEDVHVHAEHRGWRCALGHAGGLDWGPRTIHSTATSFRPPSGAGA